MIKTHVTPRAAARGVTLAALACWAAGLEAQASRTLTTFRAARGERRFDARVQLSGGSLRILPGRPDELYRLVLTRDQELMPSADYNPATGRLVVGGPSDSHDTGGGNEVRITIGAGADAADHGASSATLALSPAVDAAIRLHLVGIDADLELGGIRVSSLDVGALAGRTTIRFSRPNGTACRSARVRAGAGELSLVGLGNSRCETLLVEGGLVGEMVLDFGGSWNSSAAIGAKVVAGQLTLRIPRHVGVRLTMKKIAAGFEPNGLARRGDGFASANYESAERRLDVDVTAVLGTTVVEWIEE